MDTSPHKTLKNNIHRRFVSETTNGDIKRYWLDEMGSWPYETANIYATKVARMNECLRTCGIGEIDQSQLLSSLSKAVYGNSRRRGTQWATMTPGVRSDWDTAITALRELELVERDRERSKPTCQYCRDTGHEASTCKKLKNLLRRKPNKHQS